VRAGRGDGSSPAGGGRSSVRPILGIVAASAGSDVRWGLVDQVFSSATNFVLALLAGRWFGPHELGVVAIGFSAYLLVLGFQRALVVDPSIVSSAGLSSDDRRAAIAPALTIVLTFATGAAVALTIVGWTIGGAAGRGLLLFSPWIVPALVQDGWRFILFRDRLGRGAALNDGVWAAAMLVTLPIARSIGGLWAVVGCWGIGATAGCLLGFAQTKSRPVEIRNAVRWWREHAWGLGRWLMLESIVFAVGTHAVIFVLAGLLGARDVGGFRAAMSLFAPMTLLGPALALPGLPAISRALATSYEAARRRAATVSVAAALGAAVYVAAVGAGGGRLLGFVFGRSFSDFGPLLFPIAATQVVGGAVIGFYLLLKAQRRGRTMVMIGIVTAAASVLGAAVGAVTSGILGAAWGLAIAGACGASVTIAWALRVPVERTMDDGSNGETVRSDAGVRAPASQT
jgi:O-antigen/teichoic acid export membrane protein